MSSRPQNLVKQGILVWFPAVGPKVANEVARSIHTEEETASFYNGHPTYHGLGGRRTDGQAGGLVSGVFTYFADSPLSASDLDRAMEPISGGEHEGVSVSIADTGVSSVEFGGV